MRLVPSGAALLPSAQLQHLSRQGEGDGGRAAGRGRGGQGGGRRRGRAGGRVRGAARRLRTCALPRAAEPGGSGSFPAWPRRVSQGPPRPGPGSAAAAGEAPWAVRRAGPGRCGGGVSRGGPGGRESGGGRGRGRRSAPRRAAERRHPRLWAGAVRRGGRKRSASSAGLLLGFILGPASVRPNRKKKKSIIKKKGCRNRYPTLRSPRAAEREAGI